QITPSAQVDLAQLTEVREQDREEHEKDQDVFPKNDDLSVEEFVEGNPPRTFSSPKRGAEPDEPRSVTNGASGMLVWNHRLSRDQDQPLPRRQSFRPLFGGKSSKRQ